jgi:uncharacterized membrane protein YphA (DoxX/SURF4 family)
MGRWQDQLAAMSLVVRSLLAVVFAAATVGKARHLGSFRSTLQGVGFPRAHARWLAPLVIAYEGLLVILLMTGLAPIVTAALAACLLSAFIVVSLVAHLSRQVVACNCFGVGTSTLGLSTVARCVLLMIAAAAYAGLSLFEREPIASSLETALSIIGLTVGLLLSGRWILASATLVRLATDRRSTYIATLEPQAPHTSSAGA